MTDFLLTWIPEGGYADLVIAAADLATTDDLETAVILCLGLDSLAPADAELPDGNDRRGFWGDTWPDVEGDSTGSLLWLLAQSPQNDETLQAAITYATNALQSLIDDGLATAVSVTAEWHDFGVLALAPEITLPAGAIVVYQFLLGAPPPSSAGGHTADSTDWTADATDITADES